MVSNREYELIQTYQYNTNDMSEKVVLSHVLDELKYRIPVERKCIGSSCPICNNYVDSNAQFCSNCGQAIE